jgi:peroxiredoxin
MTIKSGERLPNGQLQEYVEVETAGCSIGPNRFDVEKLVKGKTIVVFGVPGAFTPTCSSQHVPGFLQHYEELRG